MSRAVSTVHVFLHVAEICLQMEAAVKYLDLGEVWCYIILSITVGPLVLTNLISIIWVFQNMDFTNKRCGKTVCIILHVLQLGMVWRYFKLILLYEDHDYDEFIVLRVIQALTLSAPYLIIQSFLFFKFSYSPLLVACVAIALNSLTFAFASYIEGNIREVDKTATRKDTEKTDVEGNHEKEVKEGDKVPMFRIIFVQFIWRFSILSSRLTAIVLFTVAMGYWMFLATGIHWLIVYSWSFRKECRKERRSCVDRILSAIAAYAQIFDLLNLRENENPSVISAYYLLIIVENSIFTVMALTRVHYLTTPDRKLMILSIVYGAFLLGVVFLIIYHKCVCEKKHKKVPCHFRTACCRHRRLKGDPDHMDVMFDDFTWDDYDGDIPSKDDGYVNPAFEPSVTTRSVNSSRNNSILMGRKLCSHMHNKVGHPSPKYCQTSFNYPRGQTPPRCSTPPRAGTPPRRCSNCSSPVYTPTKRSSNHSSPASSATLRRYPRIPRIPDRALTPEKRIVARNLKNTSTSTRGSSNSRNTNTLDVSIHSGQRSAPCSDTEQPSCSHQVNSRTPNDNRATPTKQRLFSSDELFYMHPSPTKMQQGQRLSAVMLSEQNNYDPKPDIVSDHDARVIFRQNIPRGVEVVYDPQRDSQSYATAKTNPGSLSDHESESDWTTCSDTDSEYARTWPPRNQAAYQKNEQLPKQEVSPVDHVAQWIKKTSSYLPTHIQSRPIDDMDIGKMRAKSEPRDHKTSGNKISRFFRAASLPRSKEALLKFCNLKSLKRDKVTPPKVKEDASPTDSTKPEEILKPSITVSTNMDIIEVLSEESIV
ncbi:XK-related protein 5-like [Lineus longissimus]|uniref:XK-related protein 5-like n=1 Tax=Lineus longissimus TaxID=88925 RepID=UPI00315CA7DD